MMQINAAQTRKRLAIIFGTFLAAIVMAVAILIGSMQWTMQEQQQQAEDAFKIEQARQRDALSHAFDDALIPSTKP